MFSKILLNAGGELPRAEAMFDALLAAQRPDGAFTDHDALGYHDMDAAFLIAHVAEHHGYRHEVTPCAVQLGGGGNTLSRLLHQRSEGGEAAWR